MFDADHQAGGHVILYIYIDVVKLASDHVAYLYVIPLKMVHILKTSFKFLYRTRHPAFYIGPAVVFNLFAAPVRPIKKIVCILPAHLKVVFMLDRERASCQARARADLYLTLPWNLAIRGH